jgi:predicted acetyltransferase
MTIPRVRPVSDVERSGAGGVHADGNGGRAVPSRLTDMSTITIRPVTEEEYPAFVLAFVEGFADDVPSDGFADVIRRTLPPERTLAAFDGDRIVGTFGGYHLELTVPGGGSVGMEGTTVVTVFPTHRRMGLLRSMMDDHLENAADAGYAIAGLWASESGIYGRFGYGLATHHLTWSMKGPSVSFRAGVTVERVRRIAAADAKSVLGPIFDRVLPTRPGMYARTGEWWDEVLLDEDWMKRGRTTKRYVVHDGPEGPDGYAIYRQKPDSGDDGHSDGKVVVVELIAATPTAEASLWAYLTRIDLCPNVESWNVPVDDPLPMMVTEPRRLGSKGPSDALWIRILDVEQALEARSYDEDGEVTFAVVDEFRPTTSGTFRMQVEGGAATMSRSDDEPDLSIDVDVLGALYLGGGDAPAYAAAGRIRGRAPQVSELHRLFRTVARPWCNQVF